MQQYQWLAWGLCQLRVSQLDILHRITIYSVMQHTHMLVKMHCSMTRSIPSSKLPISRDDFKAGEQLLPFGIWCAW
jgi:hypothetical protein